MQSTDPSADRHNDSQIAGNRDGKIEINIRKNRIKEKKNNKQKKDLQNKQEQEVKQYNVEWQSNKKNFTETIFCSCYVVVLKIFKNSKIHRRKRRNSKQEDFKTKVRKKK